MRLFTFSRPIIITLSKLRNSKVQIAICNMLKSANRLDHIYNLAHTHSLSCHSLNSQIAIYRACFCLFLNHFFYNVQCRFLEEGKLAKFHKSSFFFQFCFDLFGCYYLSHRQVIGDLICRDVNVHSRRVKLWVRCT